MFFSGMLWCHNNHQEQIPNARSNSKTTRCNHISKIKMSRFSCGVRNTIHEIQILGSEKEYVSKLFDLHVE